MDKLTTAEWLLARITSKARAEEIVGDLAERRLPAFAFWSAFTRIVLAFTWRWLVGVPAAMFSIAIVSVPYARILMHQATAHSIAHHDRILDASAYLLIAANGLVSIAFLALARYGWRSPITRIAAATTVPVALSALALCAHLLSVGIGLLAATAVLMVVLAARHTRASAAVLGTAVSFVALFFAWSFGLSLCIGITVGRFGPASTVVPLVGFLSWQALYVAEAFALARTACWLHVE